MTSEERTFVQECRLGSIQCHVQSEIPSDARTHKHLCGRSCIPAARIAKMRPHIPQEAFILAGECDELRRQDPADPRFNTMGI